MRQKDKKEVESVMVSEKIITFARVFKVKKRTTR